MDPRPKDRVGATTGAEQAVAIMRKPTLPDPARRRMAAIFLNVIRAGVTRISDPPACVAGDKAMKIARLNAVAKMALRINARRAAATASAATVALQVALRHFALSLRGTVISFWWWVGAVVFLREEGGARPCDRALLGKGWRAHGRQESDRSDDHTDPADGTAYRSQCWAPAKRSRICCGSIEAGSPSWASTT